MAATTCGWQWPVETTAMPAEKSRNSLPSTSSMMRPRPRLATSGYERVYEGERYLASPSSTRCALGPGSLVLMLGTAVAMVAMEIFSDSDFVLVSAKNHARKNAGATHREIAAERTKESGVSRCRKGLDEHWPAATRADSAGGRAWNRAASRLGPGNAWL